jgi:lysophospholipase L1-like esterase
MSQRGEWGRRALLAALGVLVAGAVLEAGVRLLGLAPELEPIVLDEPYASFVSSDNPLLRYVPRAGSGDINGYGLRDRDYDIAKAEDTFRVLVIGDSIAFGYCNPRESLAIPHTFPKVLERELGATPPAASARVEVINLGVSGYNTIQEVEFLRQKGLALDPDLVVVAYSLNDSRDHSRELKAFRRHGQWSVLRAWQTSASRSALSNSHLLRLLWYRLALLREGGRTLGTPSAAADARELGFERLRGLGERAGFDALVAIFPNFDDFEHYPHRAEHRETRRAAAEAGFGVLDLLPLFREASNGRSNALKGRCSSNHPNERGHALAGRSLADFIREAYQARSPAGAPSWGTPPAS